MAVSRVFTSSVAAAIVVASGLWWRSGRERRTDVADAAVALREMVLSRRMFADLPPASIAGAPRGVVMDWNTGNGLATLVAIDDGGVSLYLNPGGGIIGAGTHAAVVPVAELFRSEATRRRQLFRPTENYSAPGADSIVFYLLTDSATLTTGPIASRELERSDHALFALNGAAQKLVAAVRQVR